MTPARTIASPICGSAAGGVRLRVRLTPKSSRDGVDGVEHTADGPALRVCVRALPEKGAANAALTEAVAEWLAVPKSRIEVVTGGKSRLKVLFIAGDAGSLGERIATRLAGLCE